MRQKPILLILSMLILSACTAVKEDAQEKPRVETEVLISEMVRRCSADAELVPCIERSLVESVATAGPEVTIQALTTLIEQEILPRSKDYHDLVNRIGRATAKTEGITSEAFFRCPVDFNYGCQHGFFEAALTEVPDPRQAALRICDEEFLHTRPRKSLFYCFHGVGHGLLMARAYHLTDALSICDQFDRSDATEGCWQGVFMENVNGTMEGAGQGFREDDLLAPCSTLSEKYQWECYINHAGYLVPNAGSLERAAAECLREEGDGTLSCLQSIGLMATNPAWQKSLITEDRGSLIANALSICEGFPEGYEWQCIKGAIDNLANFDRKNTARSLEFCAQVSEEHRANCFFQVGRDVRNELPPEADGSAACASAPEAYRDSCLKGLRV